MSDLEFLNRIIANLEFTIKFKEEYGKYSNRKDHEDDLEKLKLLKSIRYKVEFYDKLP